MIRALVLLAAAFALIPLAPASAAGRADGVVHHETAPAALDPSKAYLLFTSSRAKSGIMTITHVMMRVPDEAELAEYRAARQAAYDKALPKLVKQAKGGPVIPVDQFDYRHKGPENIFAVDLGKSLGKSAEGADGTYLVEVPAGEYVLYGMAVGSRALAVCNCLGTVRFEAKPGVVTHLGGLYADKSHKQSPVPHIEDNLGEDMFRYGFVLSQALVPAAADSPVPAALAAFPRVLAEPRAVGPFRDPGAMNINRLAPIPGVLEYARGRVVLPEGTP